MHFYKLPVKEVKKETEDCVSILFEVPENLKENFVFSHGQYLTLRAYIQGQEVRRSYSICSSPFDNELRIAVKKTTGGLFSTYANEQLQKGDIIEAMPPLGKFFTPLHNAHKKRYVAFAAGSGITPVISIIKTTLLTEVGSSFLLVYGNRSRRSMMFKEEIEALKNRFIDRFSVVHVLSRERMDTPLNFGRIDKNKCRLLFNKTLPLPAIDEFFLCGPEEMIMEVKDYLQNSGVDKKKIHFELFLAQGLIKTASEPKKFVPVTTAKSKIIIKLDGAAFDFDLGFNETSILDAALQHGADLPFSCKSGVCCTCKAKLLEGEVDMDINYGLEPEEVEQGFILTCQSHPRTERVIVDFDVK